MLNRPDVPTPFEHCHKPFLADWHGNGLEGSFMEGTNARNCNLIRQHYGPHAYVNWDLL
jgi:hypothetical protein